ncbi:aldo/keto reductase [Natronobiforma cellulositropha]|uniref:aldo/keto reductase n=1 Tax=Natronobiforma cellulositropha TaxID=1679076 RepID=UPI0021D5BEB0|nr:aldo/keto reductase [Natronobiforma cellulositropha]
MEYTTLGSTGVSVSKIGLGCMSFGSPSWRDWVLDEDESRAILERAIDLGVNFFDTANVYSAGESERVLGSVVDEYDRDEFVLATKVRFPTDEDYPNASGLSRKSIEQNLEASLERLGVDTVDLYQIHRRCPETPPAVTMRALDDAVRRGQVRYLGASSMWAHELADYLHTADRLGLERFATMQNHYNVMYREEEREVVPLCRREGVGMIPWSPLARGCAARPHEELTATERGHSDRDRHSARHDTYLGNGGREINERLQELAADMDVSMAQVALAWLCHQDGVSAPIVGATSVSHLEEAVEATELSLSDSDLAYLEEPYEPTAVIGHD